ncbi:MAG TPA: outer membrane protein transport protein, partial [Nitrospirales bacterium]|nr:outer membrane protein transport protein [Nitrospirales bacterium]
MKDLSRNPKRIVSYAGFLASALLLAAQGVAYGEGFRLPYQGTAAAGQAEAFIAQADDASALYYNPAGLTQVRGVQAYFGANFITGKFEYTSPTGQQVDGDLRQPVVMPPPGHIYLTANLEDLGYTALGPLVVGIGLNSPFGLGSKWPDDAPFSSVVTEATVPLLDIKPTLAYKIHDMVSLGAGMDIYTFAKFIGEGQAELKTQATEINGTDTAVGFNVSALLTPLRNNAGEPLVNLGIVYRHQATLHLKGDFLVNGKKVDDAETKLPLPWVLSAGLAVWPIRDAARSWKVEVDVDYVGWSQFKSLDIRLSNAPNISQPADWENTYTFSAGTEYKWLKLTSLPNWEIALRGGYQRSNAAVPARTFTPAIPDSNWNILATGLGLKCKRGSHFLGFISCGDPNP